MKLFTVTPGKFLPPPPPPPTPQAHSSFAGQAQVFFLLLAFPLLLAACSTPSGPETKSSPYTVTFKSNYGENPTLYTKTVTPPATTIVAADFPPNPFRSGYNFAGWNTAADGLGSPFTAATTVSADITVYARWTATPPGSYTITFDSQGGSTVNPVTANAGTAVPAPTPPTKAGHTFLGWFSATAGGTLYSWPHTLNVSITLYAQWRDDTLPSPQQHTITFDSQDGSPVNPVTANAGTTVPAPTPPTKAGHTFLGWFSAAAGGTLYSWPHTLSASITMHAQWRDDTLPPLQQHTITFDSHGGSAVTAITANAETKLGQPGNPTKADNTFLGWFSAATGGTLSSWPHILSADITMHAQWRENTQPPAQQYTLTFDSHGGSEVTAITGNTETKVGQPGNPTKADSAFLGWFSAATGGTLYSWPHILSADITMHAQWRENTQPPAQQYTLTFDSHGGSEVTAITANAGTGIERPGNPTKVDSVFLGWFNAAAGGTLYSWPHILSADITMHAQWRENTQPPAQQYTITFDSHGGSEVTAITANAGTGIEQPGNPTKADSAFLGWFNAAAGGTLYTWPHTLSASITMHARWQENAPPPAQQYTITFDSHGGSEVTAITANAGTRVEQPGNPTKADSAFLGWFNAATGGTLYSWPHTLSANIAMHAQWQENTPPPAQQYTIAYTLNGGTNNAANPASYTVESPAITLAEPSRANYTFGGWHSDAGFTTAVTGIPAGSTDNKTFYAKWNPGAAVQITLQPQPEDPTLSNVSIFVDEEAQFSAAGTGYVSWQWRWDGTAISGANAAIYTLAANSRPAGVHELSVEVSVNGGQTLLARCRVTIKAK
jgi:uncharacterized repeat protein (TIGR02543 family)